MTDILKKIFSPILNCFESGEGVYAYKKSHRIILVIVGCLFSFLSVAILTAGFVFSQYAALLPGLVFFSVALVCLVVGGLGSDRAVAQIWKRK